MVIKDKYYTKTFAIFFITFLIICILSIISNNITLGIILITPLYIFVFYRQYNFIKLKYNFTNNKMKILLLTFSLLTIFCCYIYTKHINKIFDIITYIFFCSNIGLSSILFQNIENKLKIKIFRE